MDDVRLKAVDAVWCRLLCVLERLEWKGGDRTTRTTFCHDVHPDKEGVTEDDESILEEFSLQLLAFKRAIGPDIVAKQVFLVDFALWVAGRAPLQRNRVDGLAEQVAGFLVSVPEQVSEVRYEGADNQDETDTAMSISLGGEVGLTTGTVPHSHQRGGKLEAAVWLGGMERRELSGPFLIALKPVPEVA